MLQVRIRTLTKRKTVKCLINSIPGSPRATHGSTSPTRICSTPQPDRTVMVMTCSADAALSAPAAFHPAALYEFRFDTTGNGRDDTGFQLRFTDPIQFAEQGARQEFTVHYVTGADLAVDPAQRVAGKRVFSAELNIPRRVGAVHGFAGLVGDMWAADAFAVSTMLHGFYVDRRFEEAAYANRRNFFARRNAMAIVLEVPNALIGEGQVAMWSSISLYGHAGKVQVSRFGIPLFTQLFLSSWRQPLIERYNRSAPARHRTVRRTRSPLCRRVLRARGTGAH